MPHTPLQAFWQGVSSLPRAWRLFKLPALRPYLFWPVLLNLSLFIGMYVLALSWTLPLLGSWLAGVGWLMWLLAPLAAVLLLWLIALPSTLLANLLASAWNEQLAAATSHQLDPSLPLPPELSCRDQAIMVIRSLPRELKKSLLLALCWLSLLVLAWIPGLNLLALILGWLLSARLMAREYCDYPLAAAGMPQSDKQKQQLRPHRATLLGLGLACHLLHTLPLINLIAMPLSVVAATLALHERRILQAVVQQHPSNQRSAETA